MATADDDLTPDAVKGYKAPQPKSLNEIVNQDKGDESLERYKAALLGSSTVAPKDVPFPNDKRNVIVSKLIIAVVGKPDKVINLNCDTKELKSLISEKNMAVVLDEGAQYRVKIEFFVQRDIVAGLKYVMATYKKIIKVDKADVMLGSYPPRKEPYVWTSEQEEAPKGMLQRGKYVVKSRFTDDDKNDYLTWDWAIKIKEAGK